MKLSQNEIKRIAIFRALQLGDLLCSIPAIRELRNAYPKAEITLIGLPGMKELAQRFTAYFDDFVGFPGYPGLPEQGYDPVLFETFANDMRNRNFDLILQMQGNGSIVNVMLKSLGSRYFAGFCELHNEQTALLLHYPNHGHEISRHLALMVHLGIDIKTGTELEFPLLDLDYEILNTPMGTALKHKKYVCLHPGSRGTWRQWPPIYFAAIADQCINNGYQVVITGTSAEVPLATQVATLMQYKPIIAAGKTKIGEVAVLLNHAQGLISNCTGVSHIAAALKIRSIIISMDGEPNRWAPINKGLHYTIDWTANADYQLVANIASTLFF